MLSTAPQNGSSRRLSTRVCLFTGISGLAVVVSGVLATDPVQASACLPHQQVISSIAGGLDTDGGGIAIGPGGVVSAPSSIGINADYCNATTITNEGSILGSVGVGVSAGSSIDSLINLGPASLIQGATIGISVIGSSIGASGGSIGTLVNNGIIQSGGAGILLAPSSIGGSIGIGIGSLTSSGSIGLLSNTGSIGGSIGIFNVLGSIATLSNSGLIGGNGAGVGLFNLLGNIGTLNNTGTIGGGTIGIGNFSTVDSGTIYGSIGSLNNSGTITGSQFGIYNSAVDPSVSQVGIGTLNNSGLISSAGIGILNSGSIGSLTNSGTITGGDYAILSMGGGMGPITNSGTILGNISIGGQDVTIFGGSGSSSYGVLSGGLLSVTDGNLLFGTGNQQLAQDISVRGGTGTVTNAGTLLLASPQAIAGNYVQTGTGTLVLAGNASTTGRLNVSGIVNMTNAAVVVQPLGGYRIPYRTTWVVVDSATPAGTSYSGVTASGVGYTAIVSTQLIEGHYDLVLTISPSANFTQIGRDSGARAGSMGAALDALANGTSAAALAFQEQVLGAINQLPPGRQQQDAVRQTAPSQNNPGNMVQMATTAITKLVEQHQLGLLASGAGGPGMAAGSTPQGMQMWMQAMGGVSSRSTSAAVDGYSTRHAGVMIGLDWNLRPNLLVGAGFSMLQGRSELHGVTAGGRTLLNNYQFTAFATWRVTPQAFVYGQAGAGVNNFDQLRPINFLGTAARAKFDGYQYQVKGGAGYDVALRDGITVTPMAGLNYVRASANSYTETGAGLANLRVNSSTSDALTHDIGARVTRHYDTPLGQVTPELRVAWTHDYIQGPIATTGLIGGTSFFSTTQRIAADGARLNLAGTLVHRYGVTVRAEYEADLRSNYQAHAGLLRASLAF